MMEDSEEVVQLKRINAKIILWYNLTTYIGWSCENSGQRMSEHRRLTKDRQIYLKNTHI